MDVEELPVWIVDSVEDDPEQPDCRLIKMHLEENPRMIMKVWLSREDAADVLVGMKARHARVSTEAN